MTTVLRRVCGQCGAFLPKFDPTVDEADLDFLCRCGADWFLVMKLFKVGRRRQQRLPMRRPKGRRHELR